MLAEARGNIIFHSCPPLPDPSLGSRVLELGGGPPSGLHVCDPALASCDFHGVCGAQHQDWRATLCERHSGRLLVLGWIAWTVVAHVSLDPQILAFSKIPGDAVASIASRALRAGITLCFPTWSARVTQHACEPRLPACTREELGRHFRSDCGSAPCRVFPLFTTSCLGHSLSRFFLGAGWTAGYAGS